MNNLKRHSLLVRTSVACVLIAGVAACTPVVTEEPAQTQTQVRAAPVQYAAPVAPAYAPPAPAQPTQATDQSTYASQLALELLGGGDEGGGGDWGG